MRHFFFFVCAAFFPGFLAAEEVISPQIGYFEAGILCHAEIVNTEDAPDTIEGTINLVETAPDFISHDRIVPAVIGVAFGIKSSVKGDVTLPNTWVELTHPPMGDQGVTRQSYSTNIGPSGAPGITFFEFEYDYEMVTGDWTYTAYSNDTVLYSLTFRVVPPDLRPDIAAACGYEDLIG